MVFLARAVDPTAVPVVDGREIAEARYFPIDRLPANIPPRSFIAGRVLADLPRLLAKRPACSDAE
jgi:NAD+ diphosphatase